MTSSALESDNSGDCRPILRGAPRLGAGATGGRYIQRAIALSAFGLFSGDEQVDRIPVIAFQYVSTVYHGFSILSRKNVGEDLPAK